MAKITKKVGNIIIGKHIIIPDFVEKMFKVLFNGEETTLCVHKEIIFEEGEHSDVNSKEKVSVSIFDTVQKKWIGAMQKDVELIVS